MKKGKLMAGITMALMLVIGMLALTGCAPTYNQEELDTQISTAKTELTTSYEEKLSNLQEECTSKVEKLNMDASNLNADIDAFRTAKTDLEASNDVKSTEIAELNVKISELETQLAEVELACATAEDICEMVKDVSLNADFADILTDTDMVRLLDTQIEFDGGDYDVHEELTLTTDVEVTTSELGDVEFDNAPYMTIGDDESVKYSYVFDDVIDADDLVNGETLKIVFLGEDMEINSFETGEITVVKGDEYTMEEGETKTLTVNGKEVEVTVLIISDWSGATGDAKVKFKVNGEVSREITTEGSDDVDDFYVYVSEVLPNEAGETSGGDIVVFKIWDDEIETVIKTGDYFDEELELWEYVIDSDADELRSISLFNTEKYVELDDEFKAFAIGEYMSLPNDYISFGIMSLEGVEYESVEFSFDDGFGDDDILNNTVEDTVMLSLKADSDLFVIGTEEVSEVGFNGTDFYYESENDGWKTTTELKIVNNDFERDVIINASVKLVIGDFKIVFDSSTEDITKLRIVSGNIFDRDEDVLTTEGFVLKDTSDALENGEFELLIPSGKTVEAKICFK